MQRRRFVHWLCGVGLLAATPFVVTAQPAQDAPARPRNPGAVGDRPKGPRPEGGRPAGKGPRGQGPGGQRPGGPQRPRGGGRRGPR